MSIENKAKLEALETIRKELTKKGGESVKAQKFNEGGIVKPAAEAESTPDYENMSRDQLLELLRSK